MPENREIKVPPLGESISEATVARWTKQLGQSVQMDELLVELETDKITMEVTAPVAGVISAIHHPVGSTVKVGQILGLIEAGAQAHVSEQKPESSTSKQLAPEIVQPAPSIVPPQPKQSSQAPKPTLTQPPIQTPFFKPGSTQAQAQGFSPSVRKLVAETNINPQGVVGSGKEGRITKTDLLHSVAAPAEQISAPISEVMAQKESRISGAREERVRMSRLRQRIAERLKSAQNTAAILTTFNEVDMTNLNRIRAQYKETFEKKHGIKLGFMSFFVKAAIRALKEIPEVNAEISEDEIIYKNYYDIGVAVSAPQGLVVPVIRDADFLTFAEIEKKILELGQAAREGKLGIDAMTGGTFTISNGGIFGSLMSTPILNPPQTGILGMHKIQDRPVAIDGKVEIRPMMYIALSYDHRLIDGREAVTFLVRIKECIENPERLLLEV